MVWFFLAVVLVLAVSHPGFRKVLLWGAGLIASVTVVAIVIMVIQDHERKAQTAAIDPPDPCQNAADKRTCFFDPDAYLAQKGAVDPDVAAAFAGMTKKSP